MPVLGCTLAACLTPLLPSVPWRSFNSVADRSSWLVWVSCWVAAKFLGHGPCFSPSECGDLSLPCMFFSPSSKDAILVLYNCLYMSLHNLLCVVCMPCSVMAFEWLSHMLWCHTYYCAGSVWFSRNFVLFGVFSYSLIYTTQHTFDVPFLFAPSPSGWQHCSSACSSQRPQGPSARAVWDLCGRHSAQEEGEGHADCKWQWMVEWIVHVCLHL